jgi:hypothetical protein
MLDHVDPAKALDCVGVSRATILPPAQETIDGSELL